MQKKNQIIKVEKKAAEREGSIGKYLNKHIVPGNMYIVEDDDNLMGSCLYNIESPLMVITYKSYEQFMKDATRSEIEANLAKSEKENIVITDEMIAEKQLELVDKAIKCNARTSSLDYLALFNFDWQMKIPRKVVLIDDYQSIVEDGYQEFSNGPMRTMLQMAMKEYGITVIASRCSSIIEEEQVEGQESVLRITDTDNALDNIEKTRIEVFRIKGDDETDGFGAILRQSLLPSQLNIVEKTPETALSFYYSLDEPALVFTAARSSSEFLFELLCGSNTSVMDLDEIEANLSVLKNKLLFMDDTKIESISDLYDKCLQIKAIQDIKFVVIDDLQQLPVPQRVHEGIVRPDYQELCLLANEFNVAVVAFKSSFTDAEDSLPAPQQKKKRSQSQGLDAVLKAGYAE